MLPPEKPAGTGSVPDDGDQGATPDLSGIASVDLATELQRRSRLAGEAFVVIRNNIVLHPETGIIERYEVSTLLPGCLPIPLLKDMTHYLMGQLEGIQDQINNGHDERADAQAFLSEHPGAMHCRQCRCMIPNDDSSLGPEDFCACGGELQYLEDRLKADA